MVVTIWQTAINWAKVVFRSYLFLALVGALLGIFIFVGLVGRPKVGVINIPYTVLSSGSVADITTMLRYAREQGDIKAVVMNLNSPGGSVVSSEEFFFQMLETRQKKPVVVAVDGIAASGGYYAAMGANYVYVKPTSFVGSVGALIFLPKPFRFPEELFSTGPFKLTGGSRQDFVRLLEEIKESFAAVVLSQRGERLRMSKDELVSARIYSGSDAFRKGMVDAIGTEDDAIRKAARLAGLRTYKIVDVNAEVARLRKEGKGRYGAEATLLPRQQYSTPDELLADARFPYMYYLFLERP